MEASSIIIREAWKQLGKDHKLRVINQSAHEKSIFLRLPRNGVGDVVLVSESFKFFDWLIDLISRIRQFIGNSKAYLQFCCGQENHNKSAT